MNNGGPRLLLGHTFWGRGGAEIAGMWILAALGREYEIDLVTRGGWDLDDLNRVAGTEILPEHVPTVRKPPMSEVTSGGGLWVGAYRRYLRRIAPEYDLRITLSRVEDWGAPAIHFLSDVTWNLPLQKRFSCPSYRYAPEGSGLLKRIYIWAGNRMAGQSGRDPAKHDIFVANSEWTARISAEYCGRPPVIIYPAVPASGVLAPWEDRKNEFLCLGRVSPEKRVERVIAILDQVRVMGHDLRLHLAGGGEGGQYERQIQRLCDERREWVTFHGAVYGDAKKALLGRCRFGVSACDREAFGIATAEMAGAGILPFVPQAGGQSEIVREPDLIYDDIEDAAHKINAVLKSPLRQVELHQAIRERAQEFLPERFQGKVEVLVKERLEKSAGGKRKLEN